MEVSAPAMEVQNAGKECSGRVKPLIQHFESLRMASDATLRQLSSSGVYDKPSISALLSEENLSVSGGMSQVEGAASSRTESPLPLALVISESAPASPIEDTEPDSTVSSSMWLHTFAGAFAPAIVEESFAKQSAERKRKRALWFKRAAAIHMMRTQSAEAVADVYLAGDDHAACLPARAMTVGDLASFSVLGELPESVQVVPAKRTRSRTDTFVSGTPPVLWMRSFSSLHLGFADEPPNEQPPFASKRSSHRPASHVFVTRRKRLVSPRNSAAVSPEFSRKVVEIKREQAARSIPSGTHWVTRRSDGHLRKMRRSLEPEATEPIVPENEDDYDPSKMRFIASGLGIFEGRAVSEEAFGETEQPVTIEEGLIEVAEDVLLTVDHTPEAKGWGLWTWFFSRRTNETTNTQEQRPSVLSRLLNRLRYGPRRDSLAAPRS
ncbi:hypothetical protein DFJ74DRAFT_660465 [Hyaloraphidium curvatum]|nr:hypothetical protein DFJ74DRAFT_660465 [Hyaloraphidium curvatum]